MAVVYKVVGKSKEDDGIGPKQVRWGSSDAAAKKFRRELMEELLNNDIGRTWITD